MDPPPPPLPHILVLPFPVQSHISPMLHLAHFLASKSLHITFVLPRHSHARLQRAQQSQHPVSTDHLNLLGLDDGLPLTDGPRDVGLEFAAIKNLQQQVHLLAEDYRKKGTPFTCILTDPMVHWAKSFSRKFDIAFASFCVTSAAAYGAFLYMPTLVSKGIVPVMYADRKEPSSMVTLLPGFPKLCISDFPRTNGMDVFDRVMDCHKRSSEADWILVHSVYELEKASIDAMRREGLPILTIGPTILYPLVGVKDPASPGKGTAVSSLWPADEDCLLWLDNKESNSVVYVSFGSVINLRPQEIRELALGLENCGHPFLWVMRPKPEDEMNTGTGSGIEGLVPEGFLERIKDRGRIVSWVPQLRVLSHPAVGGFFFQFGWSSALESISMGVPMMGWPCFADNHANCRTLVNECGVALECKRGEEGVVERGEVERVVRVVMCCKGEGEMVRRKARELKEVVRRCVGEGESTHKGLTTFMEGVKKKKTQIM